MLEQVTGGSQNLEKKKLTQEAPNPLLMATPLMKGSSDGRYGLDKVFTLKGVRIPLKDLFYKPFKFFEVVSLIYSSLFFTLSALIFVLFFPSFFRNFEGNIYPISPPVNPPLGRGYSRGWPSTLK